MLTDKICSYIQVHIILSERILSDKTCDLSEQIFLFSIHSLRRRVVLHHYLSEVNLTNKQYKEDQISTFLGPPNCLTTFC